MAIPLTTAPGGLFTRFGKCGRTLTNCNTFQNAMQADLDALQDQYAGLAGPSPQDEPDLIAPFANSASFKSACGVLASSCKGLALQTLLRMVYEDTLIRPTSARQGLEELIRQMTASGDTVLKHTVSVGDGIEGAANVGDGRVYGSVIGPDGLERQNLFAEDLLFTCTADATAGNEMFTVQGKTAEGNPLSWAWPAGSGARTTLRTANGAANNSSGNLLTNGGFESWTVNQPGSWVITVGSAGTEVLQGTAQVLVGSYSLRLVGGATATALTQQFASTSGTSGVLADSRVYAFCGWARVDVVPAAGVLSVELLDGNGAVIDNAQGVSQAGTLSLPGLSASAWTPFALWFQTPETIPGTTRKIRLRLSTPLSSGSSLYLDNLALTAGTQAYQGGPYLAAFAGPNHFAENDTFTMTAANGRGSGGTLATFQTLCDRYFGMRQLGLVLPYAASPTISDGLIG